MNIEAKTVDESRVETVHIVRPNHLNGANRLFGGILMQWIDEVAGIVAKRHSMCNVTTASVDNLTFLHGAYQNEMVVIKGKITWVGSSSMEVCVDTLYLFLYQDAIIIDTIIESTPIPKDHILIFLESALSFPALTKASSLTLIKRPNSIALL